MGIPTVKYNTLVRIMSGSANALDTQIIAQLKAVFDKGALYHKQAIATMADITGDDITATKAFVEKSFDILDPVTISA
ncbi:MAG: hypothetical protein G01um101418_185 [Parcubacteria group bacterium Gr01-1014_18]|nr:MAG: hypothetical protein Greene041636_153 [Parcubacteria group bacterium Greene0416_36]TSC81345.1 MAG: hypothetical protein G01um101418_185 [Parcubacteria group bacterium Gr01-1014_18]TSC99469.1 MAG: hypothetical protein Greene101420_136 [Parcubacteria group bacterium Greene1014_20]TSD07612.1 MAG: hypothetical protein Greene07142_69 [Parcubacteria group bacterium Greene0714_2]